MLPYGLSTKFPAVTGMQKLLQDPRQAVALPPSVQQLGKKSQDFLQELQHLLQLLSVCLMHYKEKDLYKDTCERDGRKRDV